MIEFTSTSNKTDLEHGKHEVGGGHDPEPEHFVVNGPVVFGELGVAGVGERRFQRHVLHAYDLRAKI